MILEKVETVQDQLGKIKTRQSYNCHNRMNTITIVQRAVSGKEFKRGNAG